MKYEKNGAWGSHNGSSYPNNKMIPKSQVSGQTPTVKKLIKKRHIKKIRGDNDQTFKAT